MELRRLTKEVAKDLKVLVRVDFNVPLKDGKVMDDTRIRAHLDTINLLRTFGCRIALISHLGRPKGEFHEDLSMKVIQKAVENVYEVPVRLVDTCTGEKVRSAMDKLSNDEILLLENVRFYSEEKKNDLQFAKEMASPFDIFVMDAFSASHRAHSSTNAIQKILPSYAGLLIDKEVRMLSNVSSDPEQPFVLILGGAKVSDKIGVIEHLMNKASAILIGGGMAYTFLQVTGKAIGRSLYEEDKAEFAGEMMKKADQMGVKIVLPVDTVVAEKLNSTSGQVVNVDSMPIDLMGLDIGPDTVTCFSEYISKARTILWNGPMGVFEEAPFASGTEKIGQAVVEATKGGAVSVVGGGDTAAAVKHFGLSGQVSHVSTGGGASLEFCEGKILPGIEPLLQE